MALRAKAGGKHFTGVPELPDILLPVHDDSLSIYSDFDSGDEYDSRCRLAWV